MLKNQKGITLIALIITIIVMLILVGVTINVALNGGLFQKADDAKNLTQLALDKEELQIAVVSALNNDREIPNAQAIKNNLSNGWTVTGPDGGPYICTSPKGNTFTVDKEGSVTEGEINSGGNEPGGGSDPEKFNWQDVGLKVEPNLDYACNPAEGLVYIVNFTDDGYIVATEGTTEIMREKATEKVDSTTGKIKVNFAIAGVGNTDVLLWTNNNDNSDYSVYADIVALGQTVEYKKTREKGVYPRVYSSIYENVENVHIIELSENEIINVWENGEGEILLARRIDAEKIKECSDIITLKEEYKSFNIKDEAGIEYTKVILKEDLGPDYVYFPLIDAWSTVGRIYDSGAEAGFIISPPMCFYNWDMTSEQINTYVQAAQ